MKDLIKYYDENKGYFRHSNITNYDYDRLTNEYMELTKQEFGKFEFKEMDGAELVYDDGIWKAIYLTNVKAVMFYAKGTKWCVTAESNARSYLGYGNLMIFAKRDKKVALMCLGSNDLKNAADLDLQTNNPDMFEFVKKIMEEVFVTDDDEKKK